MTLIEQWINLRAQNLSKYEINTSGQIRGAHGIRQPFKDKDGYLLLSLYTDDNQKVTFKVHRLVALTFIPNPLKLPIVNHKDGVRDNCHVSNLEWATNAENLAAGNFVRGEKHYNAKLTDKQVEEIRKSFISGSRQFGMNALAKKYKVSFGCIRNIILENTRGIS
jgi:hypothetical protein